MMVGGDCCDGSFYQDGGGDRGEQCVVVSGVLYCVFMIDVAEVPVWYYWLLMWKRLCGFVGNCWEGELDVGVVFVFCVVDVDFVVVLLDDLFDYGQFDV